MIDTFIPIRVLMYSLQLNNHKIRLDLADQIYFHMVFALDLLDVGFPFRLLRRIPIVDDNYNV